MSPIVRSRSSVSSLCRSRAACSAASLAPTRSGIGPPRSGLVAVLAPPDHSAYPRSTLVPGTGKSSLTIGAACSRFGTWTVLGSVPMLNGPMPDRGGRRALGATAMVLVVIAGCSDDGRELRPPRPDQTLSITTAATTTSTLVSTALTQTSPTPSAPASSTRAPSTTTAALTLVTPWSETGLIDSVYSCQGRDTSPPLSWTGVPSGSAELAVVVTDPDANGFVHWVLAGLDPNAPPSVAPGRVPPAAVEAENGFSRAGWNGPCPSTGERHT